VDQTLVLTGSRTGAEGRVQLSDSSGVLDALGFFSNSAVDTESLATTQGVTAFGTTDSLVSFASGPLSGENALGAGRHTVEIGSGSNANKFRLLDENGDVVAIAGSSGGTTATTDWIDISDGTYDTGRGLTINFQGSGAYAATTFGTNAASAYFDPLRTTQSARDASLSINGLSIRSSQNGSLSNLVQGLTFNLLSTGATQITVDNDHEAITSGVNSFITKVNDLLGYIKAKTDAQKDESASTAEKAVYTRGPLAGDSSLTSLRRWIVNDILTEWTGAEDGAPSRLSDLGIELADDGLTFEIADASKLENALTEDFDGVVGLFDNVMDQLDQRLAAQLDGDYAILTTSKANVEEQIEDVDERISSAEELLEASENALRIQYESMQALLFEMEYQNQQIQLTLAGTLFNQQF
jgi:flagellar hook-associated protein 2